MVQAVQSLPPQSKTGISGLSSYSYCVCIEEKYMFLITHLLKTNAFVQELKAELNSHIFG